MYKIELTDVEHEQVCSILTAHIINTDVALRKEMKQNHEEHVEVLSDAKRYAQALLDKFLDAHETA